MTPTRNVLVVSALVFAAVLATTRETSGQGREPGRSEVRASVKAVDVAARTITVAVAETRETVKETTYALAKDAEIVLGIAGAGRGTLFQEVKLADLLEGTRVALALAADMKTVDAVVAEPPTFRGLLKSVDAVKNTLVVALPAGREAAPEEKTFTVAAGAEVIVDDGRGRRTSLRDGKLADLGAGSFVTLFLSLDQKKAQTVLAEGPNLFGVVKAVDAVKNSVTLTVRPARGDDAGEEKTLGVAPEAAILIDDGRGRRLSLKAGKLADVPVGSMAQLKLSVDQSTIMQLRVEGPTLLGFIKAVDAVKGTITLAIPKGRDDADEKTLNLAKDVRLSIEGGGGKLGDLKTGMDGHIVQVRLSLDQRTAQAIVARLPGSR